MGLGSRKTVLVLFGKTTLVLLDFFLNWTKRICDELLSPVLESRFVDQT